MQQSEYTAIAPNSEEMLCMSGCVFYSYWSLPSVAAFVVSSLTLDVFCAMLIWVPSQFLTLQFIRGKHSLIMRDGCTRNVHLSTITHRILYLLSRTAVWTLNTPPIFHYMNIYVVLASKDFNYLFVILQEMKIDFHVQRQTPPITGSTFRDPNNSTATITIVNYCKERNQTQNFNRF